MENIKEALKDYGLGEKEIEVYQASLKLGTVSITQIAKEAEIKRPTTYLIVEELRKKGLLVQVPIGKKTFYKPVEPDKLIDYFDEKREKLLEVVPFLRHWYTSSLKQPKVTFYEGKNQLKEIYKEVFSAKVIWAAVSFDKFFEVFTYEDNKYFFKLTKKQGGKIHDLVQYSSKSKKYLKADYRKGASEEKFLPKGFDFQTDVLVNDKNKLALISLDNVSGVLIEDDAIAETLRMMLQYIWKSIK